MKHFLIKLGKFSAFSFLLIPVTSANSLFPALLPAKSIDKPAILFEASYKPPKAQISGTVAFQTYQPPKPKPASILAAPKPVFLETATTTPLDELFGRYASQYGVSKDLLIKIAKCESGLNPNAGGRYGGLFQFASGTWSSNRKVMGLDPDPKLRFNAEEAIKTAAFKISRDGAGAWPVCSQ